MEGKINQIKFCHPVGNNNFILSTNGKPIFSVFLLLLILRYIQDKTIKLWKIGPKLKYLSSSLSHYNQFKEIVFPAVDNDINNETELLHATTKRIFANAHAYHINSLALNSDTETFISADDLRINLWKLENSDTAFSKFKIYVVFL
jgi:serine/threonine-protein phosphatase 2A regulatory subunit B